MVEISKHLFDTVCTHMECNKLMHPWHESCITGNIMCFLQAIKGSYRFYSVVYAMQILMKGRPLTKEEWISMGRDYVKSGMLGFMVTTLICGLGCVWRNALGSFGYYRFIMTQGFVLGAFIYLEPPKRRSLVINLFVNLVLEYWIRHAQNAGYLSVTPAKLTLFFMAGSSLLFYLQRLEGEKKNKTPLLWLFTPEKVHKPEYNNNDKSKPIPVQVCPHKGSCLKHIAKSSGLLFSVGFGISSIRILMSKGKFTMKDLKLPMFFGSYIGIYKGIVCILCRKFGRDSATYALPAGFIAGASFVLSPSLSLAIASVTAAMKLVTTIMYDKKMITEKVPLPELTFCVCQGILYHARVMHEDVCPGYVMKLMSGCSNGYINETQKKLVEAVTTYQRITK